MRRPWSAVFLALGLLSLAVACHATLERTGGAVAPPPGALLLAGVILGLGLLAASLGWLSLLAGAAPAGELVHGFMVAQLGKYIPGGVWLGVGQIGLAVGAGVGAARAAGAVAVLGVAFFAAGATLAGITALPGSPGVVHGVATIGLAAPALLHRRWMSLLADRLVRRFARGTRTALVPSQPRILGAAIAGFATLVCSALAFAVLLTALDPSVGIHQAAAGFAAAWLAGYLAIGLPSGIGAREAVLVALLPGGAGPVLAASLAQRLVQMALEAALAGGSRLLVRGHAIPSQTLPMEVPRA